MTDGYQTARNLCRQLDGFAGLNPPYQRWLGGDKADAGPSYCQSCAEKAVAADLGEFVDGGWPCQSEDDTCQHCETCGCLLDYTLNGYGVSAELDHFSEYPPKAPISKELAYHVARVLEGAPENVDAQILARLTLAEISITTSAAEDREDG